jgi:hypothetical protein
MGIPTAIASRNGERRELKHLSTGRKRKRNAMSSVTAGKRDTAQTEGLTTDVVYWANVHHSNAVKKSPGTGRETG